MPTALVPAWGCNIGSGGHSPLNSPCDNHRGTSGSKLIGPRGNVQPDGAMHASTIKEIVKRRCMQIDREKDVSVSVFAERKLEVTVRFYPSRFFEA